MIEEDLYDNFNDSTQDNKLEIFNHFKNLNIGDKSLKIEAYPGAGKTFLITKLIKLIDLRKQGYVAISHMNSAIDTLEGNLKGLEIKEPKVQTFVSFFLINFLIPLGFKISKNTNHNFNFSDSDFLEKTFYIKSRELNQIKLNSINLSLNDFINKNLKTNKGFSESDIDSSKEWGFIKYLIIFYLQKEEYLNFFVKLLKSEGIKYIFIDEYQDSDIEFMEIIKNIITRQEFIFYITGDINQDLSYNNGNIINFSDIPELLEEKEIIVKITPERYREKSNIFELIKKLKETQFILDDGETICGFNDCIEKIDWCYSNNLNNFSLYPSDRNKPIIDREEMSYINKIVASLGDIIVDNIDDFKGKNNVILTFIQTDNKLGAKILEKIEQKLNLLSNEINIIGGEKNITDYHLPKLIEKIILFIKNKKNSYSDIEKELKFIINYGSSNVNLIFQQIITINGDNNIEFLINKLNEIFQNGEIKIKKSYFENNKLKKILDLIKISLGEKLLYNINLENKKLYEIIKNSPNNIAKFTINTIHSSKGKEYDNVIILELTNQGFNKIWINQGLNSEIGLNTEKQFRNMYYVGLSRAKEKIFTFIDF